MKSLKEKLQDTIKKHKKEVCDNLRDKAVHIGNLKNIKPGDKIFAYYGDFYTVPKYVKIYLIDIKTEAIFIHLHSKIMRFNAFNCREWALDHEKPCGKDTTAKENWALADNNKFNNLIKYPIINVKFKKELPISADSLCYNTENLTVCPYLEFTVVGSYWCVYMKDYLFENDKWGLNTKLCKRRNKRQS